MCQKLWDTKMKVAIKSLIFKLTSNNLNIYLYNSHLLPKYQVIASLIQNMS